MSSIHAHSIQHAVRQWFALDRLNHPFAVTLTMKQRIAGDGVTTMGETLTEDIASKNLSHFLNVLNGRVYGNAATRFGKRVPVLSMLEGGPFKRLHYHLLIDCPRTDLIESFPSMIGTAWRNTRWGYDRIDVQPGNAGWLAYITKLRDKPNFADYIDWMNTTRH